MKLLKKFGVIAFIMIAFPIIIFGCGESSPGMDLASKTAAIAAKAAIDPILDNVVQGLDTEKAEQIANTDHAALIESAVTKFLTEGTIADLPAKERAMEAVKLAVEDVLNDAQANGQG